MFDLTTYVKKWRIRQLKTVFSTLDTLCGRCHLHNEEDEEYGDKESGVAEEDKEAEEVEEEEEGEDEKEEEAEDEEENWRSTDG